MWLLLAKVEVESLLLLNSSNNFIKSHQETSYLTKQTPKASTFANFANK